MERSWGARLDRVLAGLAIVALVAACSKAIPTESPPAPPATGSPGSMHGTNTITFNIGGSGTQNIKSLSASEGDSVLVSLESNPSTGYRWKVTNEGNPDVVKPLKSSSSPAATPMPGAPGTQEFSYLIVGTGTTTLKYVYVKAGSDKPDQSASLRIRAA